MPAKLYDWDGWFAALPITLRRGDHYACSQSMMAQQIRSAASARGVPVSLEDKGDRIIVRRNGDHRDE
jgi:hypothetical protein